MPDIASRYDGYNGLYRLTADVELTYSGKTIQVVALIDSGSEITYFDKATATMLGVQEIASGRAVKVEGIGSGSLKVFLHEVEINAKGFRPEPCMIGFADGPVSSQHAGILGSKGFFEFYSVKLEYSHRITIESQVQRLTDSP